MEYEIESEFMLFDASTNPSLEPALRRPLREGKLPARRRVQNAETIPDEEEQAA